jgi:hypothetical protein
MAAAYLGAMPYFLVFVNYPSVTDPAGRVAMLVGHHQSMQVMYLITYVIFGVVLAVLTLALHARLRSREPVLSQSAAVVGLIWAVMLLASGMIFNAGMEAVVKLHGSDATQAVSAWQAIEPVAQGLGGSGGELLGGLWVLLVSVAALRTGALPAALNWLGVIIGVAGLLSVAPPLHAAVYAFGLLQIVWFIWLGIVLLRTRAPSPDAA